jgi:hypothetical protein
MESGYRMKVKNSFTAQNICKRDYLSSCAAGVLFYRYGSELGSSALCKRIERVNEDKEGVRCTNFFSKAVS